MFDRTSTLDPFILRKSKDITHRKTASIQISCHEKDAMVGLDRKVGLEELVIDEVPVGVRQWFPSTKEAMQHRTTPLSGG
jgi:hypothetical protein